MVVFYLQKLLGRDEKLIYATHVHWIVFAPSCAIFVAAFLVWYFLPSYLSFNQPIWHGYLFYQIVSGLLLIVGVFSWIRCYISYVMTEYGITTRRVIMKQGWLQRRVVEVFLLRIEGSSTNQSFIGQIFNYGTVVIIGTGGTYDHYPDVPNPEKFHQIIQDQITALTSSDPNRNRAEASKD